MAEPQDRKIATPAARDPAPEGRRSGSPPKLEAPMPGEAGSEWDEPVAEGVTVSSNESRAAMRSEAQRGQGAKTRRANKDIVSRRN